MPLGLSRTRQGARKASGEVRVSLMISTKSLTARRTTDTAPAQAVIRFGFGTYRRFRAVVRFLCVVENHHLSVPPARKHWGIPLSEDMLSTSHLSYNAPKGRASLGQELSSVGLRLSFPFSGCQVRPFFKNVCCPLRRNVYIPIPPSPVVMGIGAHRAKYCADKPDILVSHIRPMGCVPCLCHGLQMVRPASQ